MPLPALTRGQGGPGRRCRGGGKRLSLVEGRYDTIPAPTGEDATRPRRGNITPNETREDAAAKTRGGGARYGRGRGRGRAYYVDVSLYSHLYLLLPSSYFQDGQRETCPRRGEGATFIEEEKIAADDAVRGQRLPPSVHDQGAQGHPTPTQEHRHLPSKFLQDNNNAWPLLLFETKLAIQDTSAATTASYPDVSRMDRIKDLRRRGEKTILLKKSGVEVAPEVARSYDKVELMNPAVQKYCLLYCKNLSERLGLNESSLPPAYTNHVLVNPLFGSKQKIVGSGLLAEGQYIRARRGKTSVCFTANRAYSFLTLRLAALSSLAS